MALSCIFETFTRGEGLGQWVIRKSDFNENPVVQLGLRLRVCQYQVELLVRSLDSEYFVLNPQEKENLFVLALTGVYCMSIC